MTRIGVMLGVPNESLRGLNASRKAAEDWVQDNVTRYVANTDGGGIIRIECSLKRLLVVLLDIAFVPDDPNHGRREAEKGCEDMARSILVESVNNYTWSWSAWSDLQSLCTTPGILGSLNLKNHWMKDFFLAGTYQELKMFNEALGKYQNLPSIFRFSDYIKVQASFAQYSLRELDDAEMLFEEVLRNDTYRIDSMDVYSNVLRRRVSVCLVIWHTE